MNLTQALQMQAAAWQHLTHFTEKLAGFDGDPWELHLKIEAWSKLHTAACQVLDQLRQQGPNEDYLMLGHQALMCCQELFKDGGLTVANAVDVRLVLEQLIDQMEG
jgi:hypothetical protein